MVSKKIKRVRGIYFIFIGDTSANTTWEYLIAVFSNEIVFVSFSLLLLLRLSIKKFKTFHTLGANPTARQPLTLATPLHLACLQSVRGAQATNTNSTSISNDILSSNLLLINKIKLLLHYGCDDTNPNDFTFINLKDQADMTPLHAACLSGQDVSIVELLLLNGADPNAQDQAVCVDAGWTPMHHLAAGIMYDQIDTVNVAKMLLKYKADPSIRGRWIDKKDMNTMGGGGGTGKFVNERGRREKGRILHYLLKWICNMCICCCCCCCCS